MVGCILCVFVLLGIIAAISLDVVPPLHVGIKYNSFAKTADTENVFGPGRYVVGPFTKLVLFPSTAQNIDYEHEPRLRFFGQRTSPLASKTKDGMDIHLRVSLQYKLRKQLVGK